MSILDLLKNLFKKENQAPARKPADLQLAFRRQYRGFRSLLTANNNALELMAEIEQTLDGTRPFSMAFVRGHCTALTVNVLKMIQQLQMLADGGYQSLQEPFTRISSEIDAILRRQPPIVGTDFVLPLASIDRHHGDQVGEKMANLGEIRNRIGLRVPEGFTITAAAARYFFEYNQLQPEINRRLKTLDPEDLEELYTTSASIQHLISNAPLPTDLEQQIVAHYDELARREGREILVSMRSSALGEDSGNVSFAGQYRTQLHVNRELLGRTYREIVASKYRSQAIVYRLQRGFRHQDVTMAVGCLAMIDGAVSGVIFSRPPGDHRGEWTEISAAPGLPDQVVDGRIATDQYRVARSAPHPILEKNPRLSALKATGKESLTSGQAAELARIAMSLEKHFGAPQDIEWSIDRRGAIQILQSRPLGAAAQSKAVVAKVSPAAEEEVLLKGGVTASQGVACGKVHLVQTNVDLLSFPPGAVLVVIHPLPDWAALLPRAVAVVSETGQIAAHLATVAREFGIPAIFGLEGAAARLAQGEEITVDATGCRIFPGRIEELLAQAPIPPKLMTDSPVYRLLQEASRLITPLNLTDPASPFFRPSSCRTLHDLTRFCHEKAVAEMFSFGSRYGFDVRAAKRLVDDTPYDWWVIDLEDGFMPGLDPKDRFIHLSHIVSTPMLAIWRGMTTFPWEGPPPVSLKGFGAILFRSTMNPALEPAIRSNLNARNYFLVSKNFCNLSIRLGYHFALVESHISDLLTENYVSLQFKGGAADEERRHLRVQLIREILARYDFRIEQKGDALTARLEKKEAPFLLERLKILGYLLIHTRQIDMVMSEPGMVSHYRNKLITNIEIMLKAGRPDTLIH
jgi:pyruvate, water dikinase